MVRARVTLMSLAIRELGVVRMYAFRYFTLMEAGKEAFHAILFSSYGKKVARGWDWVYLKMDVG